MPRRTRLPRPETQLALRAAIDALVAGLPEPRQVPGLQLDLGTLTYLRETFIAAGTERVVRLMRPRAWHQVGLSFASPRQRDRLLRDGWLRRTAESWLRRGLVESFWFMNKPPGMRVRFCATTAGDPFEGRLTALFDEARRARRIARFELGVYDEETHQFGGEAGLEAFHRFSTSDCLNLLKLRELQAKGGSSTDTAVFSLLAMTDLVAQVAGDEWEQWDAWCEMRLTGRIAPDSPGIPRGFGAAFEDNRGLVEAAVHERSRVLAELGGPERRLLQAYRLAGRELRDALAQAAHDGTLLFPPRKILPFVIIFHWNRAGLGWREQQALAYFVREVLSPKRPRH